MKSFENCIHEESETSARRSYDKHSNQQNNNNDNVIVWIPKMVSPNDTYVAEYQWCFRDRYFVQLFTLKTNLHCFFLFCFSFAFLILLGGLGTFMAATDQKYVFTISVLFRFILWHFSQFVNHSLSKWWQRPWQLLSWKASNVHVFDIMVQEKWLNCSLDLLAPFSLFWRMI